MHSSHIAVRRKVAPILVGFIFTGIAIAQIDLNNNSLSDIWEAVYGWGLEPDEDTDHDGFTNREESLAGTNPHDPLSYPRSHAFEFKSADVVSVGFPTKPGIQYHLTGSPDFSTWYPFGEPVIGNGLALELDIHLNETFISGGIRHDTWVALTNHGFGLGWIKYFVTNNSAPDLSRSITQLDIPQSVPNQDAVGNYMQGWLIPPYSGFYTFWIASDDHAELWLSTNFSAAYKSLVASVPEWTSYREWTKYPQQQSMPIYLHGHQSYYFEVFHREYWGGDHLSVAWTRPDAAPAEREILAAPHLSPDPRSLAEIVGDGGSLIFRISMTPVDSDSDGVTDFEEHYLGLDRTNPTTTPRQADLIAAHRILESQDAVTIGATIPRAYESNLSPAQFTIYRAGSIEPITIAYQISGTAEPGVDYVPLSGVISLAAGERVAIIDVVPLADAIIEPPETVTVTLLPGDGFVVANPSASTITIDDSPDILYVAQLRPPPGGISGGAGIASVRRAGNGLTAKVNVSFSGLTDSQINTELYVSSNGIAGPATLTLPPEQVALMNWSMDPTNGISKLEMIQSLDSEAMWVRIPTALFPSGELIGQLVIAPGWFEMPTPHDPPEATASPLNSGDASRFLTQATFGPDLETISILTNGSFASWIDEQLLIPPTYHLPYVQHRRAELLVRDGNEGWQLPRQMAWWQHALTAPDQLRQRMAWALSQIFVISEFGPLEAEYVGNTIYYDMLLEHAFGNYRDLLEDVTLSPMMGIYLSMMRNQKPNPVTGHEPDENFAREVMQLFSVGLMEMHTDGSLKLSADGMPIPTYTQQDTTELAHIFTGWSAHYDPSDPPYWDPDNMADPASWFFWGWDSIRPMSFYGAYHDQEARTLLGNQIVPAGTNGIDRLQQALDILFHHPNVGPFMARQLIQRFITSNPSPGYIYRVASVFNDNGSGVRGDLGATLKAVLLDPEARNAEYLNSVSFGKPIEPILRLTRMFRAFLPSAPFAGSGDSRLFIDYLWSLPEQAPLYSSSVFNFYQPVYKQPGRIAQLGLLSPEFQIYAETTAIRQANLLYSALNWGVWTHETIGTNGNVVLSLNIDPLVDLLNTEGVTPAVAQDMLIDALDILLLSGAMSEELKNNIRSFYSSLPGWFDFSTTNQRHRVRYAIYLIMNSPEFLTQK